MWKTYNAFCRWTERALFKKKGCFFSWLDLVIGIVWVGVSAVFLMAGFYYALFCFFRWIWRKIFPKKNPFETMQKETQEREQISDIGFDENMDGLTYEKYCAGRLKLYGYTDITVTKASGDYGADIIATDKDGNKVCVQCKKYQEAVDLKAVQEAIAAMGHYNCTKAMVLTTSTFTRSAYTLARDWGVKLIPNFK